MSVGYMDRQKVTFESIAAAQAGNTHAMESLLTQYQGLLISVARRYQSSHSFDDIYQDACVIFIHGVQRFNFELGIPFTAFITQHVRRNVFTSVRRVWRDRDRQIHPSLHNEEEDAVGDLWDHAALAMELHERDYDSLLSALDLRQAIARAGLSQREHQWVVAHLRGVGTKELAAALHVSVTTVRTWKKRALQKLRAVLSVAEFSFQS